MPLSEVKGRQAELVEEWLQVESYQKTLASHTPKPARDDGEWLLSGQIYSRTSLI